MFNNITMAHCNCLLVSIRHNDAVLSIGGEEMRVGTRQGVQSARIAIKMAEDLQSMIPARDRTGQIFVGGVSKIYKYTRLFFYIYNEIILW